MNPLTNDEWCHIMEFIKNNIDVGPSIKIISDINEKKIIRIFQCKLSNNIYIIYLIT